MNLLDNTLRDGSYIVDFQFSRDDTSDLVSGLERNGIDYIEVGHGLGLGAYRNSVYSAKEDDETYIKAAVEVSNKAKIGVFCLPNLTTMDDLFLAADCGIGFIRIGVFGNEIKKAEKFIEKAKKLNIYTCVNFLKSYAVTPDDFSDYVAMAQSMGADTCYVVDSAGTMTPKEVEEYFEAVQAKNSISLSFHGHNNLGLATANALKALECGAEFIDVSLQGMGRSLGNTPTEQFVALLHKQNIHQGIDLIGLMDIAEKLVRPKLKMIGFDTIDVVCGLSGFHSGYLNVIHEFSQKYDIDPRNLIMEVGKESRLDAPTELVERVAKMLKRSPQNSVI